MLLVIAGAVAITRTLAGSTPTFWQVATQADFLKGEVEHLSVHTDGRVVLGPSSQVLHDSSSPFVWALTAAPDGTLWAGSGNQGQVLKIDKDGKVTTGFDAAELEVHALAAAPDGTVYAGTSPDGKVYRIAKDGTASTFFDPDDKYIWSLALAGDGTLYVATGEKGVIYKVGTDGKGTPFYKTKATHAMTLGFDSSGQLLAGTESPGKVFRIDRDGKGFVLLDSPYREIRALRVDSTGAVYVAAMSGKGAAADDRSETPPAIDAPRPPVASVTTEISAVTVGDVQVSAPLPTGPIRRDERSLAGAVYRIAPDGLWDIVWSSPDDSPYDLVLETASTLIVGTGNKGKIFRVSVNPASVTLLARAPAQQVTSLWRDTAGNTVFSTSNPGKIVRLSSGRAERGTYESDVRDASTVASWGSIRWRAGTPTGTEVQIFTRSGNTQRPDDTWSEWAGPYKTSDGSAITSPKARYLQWKAVLLGKAASPTLTSVTTAYLERNLRPVVESVTVHAPGVAFQKPFSTGELEIAGFDPEPMDGRTTASAVPSISAPPLGRRVYQKGLQTFVWKASDPNDDKLQYDVLYRAEGESTWKPLRRAMWDAIFVWDTTSVPDGSYVVKVVATDGASNSPVTVLMGEQESTAFDIDNTPPVVRLSEVTRMGARAVLRFSVEDAHSAVQRVEYSLDANRWRLVYPVDGIPDSRSEKFDLTFESAEARSVIIRAADAMNNSATAEATIPARKPGLE